MVVLGSHAKPKSSDPFSFFEESLMGALVTEEVGKGVTGVQVSVCSI